LGIVKYRDQYAREISRLAHANKPYSSDPDDPRELRRLHVAAEILRALARRFIHDELGVSDCPYDGS